MLKSSNAIHTQVQLFEMLPRRSHQILTAFVRNIVQSYFTLTLPNSSTLRFFQGAKLKALTVEVSSLQLPPINTKILISNFVNWYLDSTKKEVQFASVILFEFALSS